MTRILFISLKYILHLYFCYVKRTTVTIIYTLILTFQSNSKKIFNCMCIQYVVSFCVSLYRLLAKIFVIYIGTNRFSYFQL